MSKKLSRRAFLRTSAGAAAGALLAACQPQTVIVEKESTVLVEKEVEKVVTATVPPKGKTHIIYYERTTSAPEWADPYNDMQDAVEVEVQIQPPGTRYEQLMAAITAGNAPDVIGLDCVQVGRFAQLGALAPLEDAIPQETMAKYFPNLISVEGHYGQYGGHVVGVPFWVDNSVCFYNKAFLEEAGGDPEVGIQSWSDYINYGKEITQGDRIGMAMLGSGGGIEFLYWPWLWAIGGDICNEDWTASTVDSPEVMDTFEFIQSMVLKEQVTNDAVATDWTTAFGLFTSQNAMVCHQGGGGVGTIRSEFPEVWDVLGVCPIPGAEEGQTSSFIGGNVASLTMQSKEKEAALDFLTWVTSSDEGMSITGEIGYLPGCPSGIDLPVYQESPAIYEAYREGLTTGWPSSNNPHYDEVMVVMRVAFADVCLGEMSLEAIAERAHGEITRIVERV
jgi:multiple sugar transport system substrate-binding protein